jgi:serine/threonine protein kinase
MPGSNRPETWLKVDAIVNRFEEACRETGTPAIDDYLPEESQLRLLVLKELVHVVVERRRQAGEPAQLEDYLEQYPELATLFTKPTVVFDKPVTNGSPELPKQVGRYRVERFLGQGTFAVVYLAHDDQLRRLVAIKVPRQGLMAHPEDAELYLTEARTVAGLEHPNIVPVYDAGSTDDHPFFVVSKYIDGSTLAQRMRENRPTVREAAGLVKTVAETLHYAHLKGLVHRDIKPSNILLEWRAGQAKPPVPYVADFGLALKDENLGQGPKFAGTPAYMSPEQARGEGHRVNGRSDIFSLGVVFYELLTGRRPFHAASQDELLNQIASMEVRPPRQWDDTIPKELERICLKALGKRAAERYTTARDMAEDLGHFLEETTEEQSPLTGPAAETPSHPRLLDSASHPIHIVPKGLRSFDTHDADFFLELVPGPRDRNGLPESIRFWKSRIEEMDADNTFAVGLIYGPSGCGKSSLVKAGLLPRLSETVIPVYVEATAQETETRLLNGLRKKCPDLPADLALKETLAALRRGQGVPEGTKVLVILDQFEQWLHASGDPGAAGGRSQSASELVEALRQCSGRRVQCLVMVRDDFWLAVSRFLKDLEIRLLEGQNSALVDLFDLDHAKKVLAAFGRAFGKLPKNPAETTNEQKQFLMQAIAGLATGGKVICVRLALFAEMMKGKVWTPASLRAMGGTEGVGLTFLEETFSATTAPPEHRYHQKAARGVLEALAPALGTDIKGHMKSHQELLDASGYGSRSRDFEELIRILDNELRLITPTDPEGKDEGGRMKEAPQPSDSSSTFRPSSMRYYQLTHDHLVHSLRDWLKRKQKETKEGRAQLLLEDLAQVWNVRRENKQLPSFLQWLQIRWWTRKNHWTEPQRNMMNRAARYYAARASVVAACLLLLGLVAREWLCQVQAHTLVARLLDVKTSGVPAIVEEMEPYRPWVNPRLRDALQQADRDNDRGKKLHASLALLPEDPDQVDFLSRQLLDAEPAEFAVIREALRKHHPGRHPGLVQEWWRMLARRAQDDQRLRAAGALADFDPNNGEWKSVREDVIDLLERQKPLEAAQWTYALKGMGHWLKPFKDQKDLKRQAGVLVALLIMGQGDDVWPLLRHTLDPTLRSFLIERIGTGGVDPKVLIARLGQDKDDVSVKRAILLGLGGADRERLSAADQEGFLAWLKKLYESDPDPGIHGAAELLLRQPHWNQEKWVTEVNASWARATAKRTRDLGEITRSLIKEKGPPRWYVTGHKHTMVVLPDPKVMGRGFAISSKEVTVAQFQEFREDYKKNKEAPEADCPVNMVTWYDAVKYCEWLNDQEGILESQRCYLANANGEFAKGMKVRRQGTGYRLPTKEEWVQACWAGATTEYSFGDAEDLLGNYAWYSRNSSTTRRVGTLKPNDFGLFDMYGNVFELVQLEMAEKEDVTETNKKRNSMAQGGSFVTRGDWMGRSLLTSAPSPVAQPNVHVGFRLARSCPDPQ